MSETNWAIATLHYSGMIIISTYILSILLYYIFLTKNYILAVFVFFQYIIDGYTHSFFKNNTYIV